MPWVKFTDEENKMQISEKTAVTINYTLKDNEGNLLDTSEEQGPMTYIHGLGHLLPALEEKLNGKAAGDKVEATLEPSEGYGEYDETLIYSVPNQGADGLEPGMHVEVQTDMGPRIMTVEEIKDDTIALNANHPLAGTTLNFAVEVVSVREASEEEIDKAVNGCGCGCGDEGCEDGHEHGGEGCGCGDGGCC